MAPCESHFAWRVGQAAKTPPFHGGNTGSIPVRVTTDGKNRSRLPGGLAQLVRAPASHAGGQRFESVYAHQIKAVHSSEWAAFILCTKTEPMPLPPRKAVRPFSGSSQREMPRSQAVRAAQQRELEWLGTTKKPGRNKPAPA